MTQVELGTQPIMFEQEIKRKREAIIDMGDIPCAIPHCIYTAGCEDSQWCPKHYHGGGLTEVTDAIPLVLGQDDSEQVCMDVVGWVEENYVPKDDGYPKMNPMPPVPHDPVNHPSHYTSGPEHDACGMPIECIDVSETFGFNLGNAIKYIWRADHKGRKAEDLAKAIWYLQRELNRLDELFGRSKTS